MYDCVLILGPCRSGTTFLFNALASSHYIGIFQPLKHILRCEHMKIDPTISLRDFVGKRLVLKEAFGPYLASEATYDPVELLANNLSLKKILLITILRNPIDCLSSWIASFKVTPDEAAIRLSQAYDNTVRVHTKYLQKMDSVSLILEDEADCRNKINLIRKAMGSVPLPDQYDQYIKPNDPPGFQVSGLLKKALSGQEYKAENIEKRKLFFDKKKLKIAVSHYENLHNLKPRLSGNFSV
ncbi:sulfotransferase domain-containing protein [Pseudomonas brassicacearum]|uniref:sulfotransferase domain-containing protein n=1 Tax=Pseudomonas brassicacearum TaxID=930166 RepID=UPI003323F0ED